MSRSNIKVTVFEKKKKKKAVAEAFVVIKIVAQGSKLAPPLSSQVLHRPFVQNTVPQCQIFLNAWVFVYKIQVNAIHNIFKVWQLL